MSIEIYQIVERATGETIGAYSRANRTEYDFRSAARARAANGHDVFQDRDKYQIDKYRVTYELIEEDCDNPPENKPGE